MDRREVNRQFLVANMGGNQMALPGVGVFNRETTVEDAFDKLRGLSARVGEAAHPLAQQQRRQPSHQHSHDFRSKARPEIMRNAQKFDMEVNQQRYAWSAHGKVIDGDEPGLETQGRQEAHKATGFYAVSDRYAQLAEQAKAAGEKDHTARHMGIALEQRAAVLNDLGVRHDIRARVAQKGLMGVMEKGNLSQGHALEKVRNAGALDVMDKFFMEDAKQKGADVDGLLPEADLKHAIEQGDPNAKAHIAQLRHAAICVAYDKSYRGPDRREHMIKRAALLRVAREAGEGNVDDKEASNVDKEIMKRGVMPAHPLMRRMRTMTRAIEERAASQPVKEDSYAR